MKITSHIDSDFVDKAEEEIFQILLQQRLAFNKRWQPNDSANRAMEWLRMFAAALCVLGAGIIIYSIINKPGWCPGWLQREHFILFFLLAGIVIYYLPRLQQATIKWTVNVAEKSCKKMAVKCMSLARNIVPYQNEYEIKGGLVSCYRGKDDKWELAWSMKMKGMIVHGNYVSVLFKKRKSILPKAIILHENDQNMINALNKLELEIKPLNA